MLIEKLPDLANLAAGALVFGQFVSQESFSLWLAGGGLVVWILVMGSVLVLAENNK